MYDVDDTTKLQVKDKIVKNSISKINMETEKRFARLHMVRNIVITTETTSLTNKETSKYPSISLQSLVEPNVVEKICTKYFFNEKP